MSTLREKITKILYQNSHDDSECLRIKFENIAKVIDLIVGCCHSELKASKMAKASKPTDYAELKKFYATVMNASINYDRKNIGEDGYVEVIEEALSNVNLTEKILS